ncbi:MAG: hypothetical protein AAB556_00815 [Patescibacteria group bacterium]
MEKPVDNVDKLELARIYPSRRSPRLAEAFGEAQVGEGGLHPN